MVLGRSCFLKFGDALKSFLAPFEVSISFWPRETLKAEYRAFGLRAGL